MTRAKVGVVFDVDTTAPFPLLDAVGDLAEIIWVIGDGRDGGRLVRALLERSGHVVEVVSSDPDAAAESLRDQGIEAILTFSDEHIVLTAEIAQRLELPGCPPHVAVTVRNKFLQRLALRAANVPQPQVWHLPPGLTAGELHDVASTVSYPAMLKPAEGTGQEGILRVVSAAEVEAAYDPAADQIVEEFMVETEARDKRFTGHVSVDSAVTEAGISHALIQSNFALDGYRLTGRFIPSVFDEHINQQILEAVREGIQALGIRYSLVNTDVMITDDGPIIIEINGRVGGASPDYLSLVSDVHLRRTAVEVALGRPIKFETLVPVRGVGFRWDVNAPVGAHSFVAVHGTEELAALPWCDLVQMQARPGDPLSRTGTFGVVKVLGHTADTKELAAAVDLINHTVKIEYEFDR